LGLEPVMTLTASVAKTKRVPVDTGVSYDYTYRTSAETTLALVPVGYADGVPRRAQGRIEVTIAGKRYPIAGRVAMDQFLVDVGDDEVRPDVGRGAVAVQTGVDAEVHAGGTLVDDVDDPLQ
ncbi:alanine racemase, partial [Clavibacter michiganensis]|uniref:alanine racemase n=1 Tax=Clavibacter michiganensis TaxID=28447 RepID=UPI00292D5199